MFKKCIILFLWSTVAFSATTRQQAFEIYSQIIKANGFIAYPTLIFSNDKKVNANANWFRIQIHQGMLDSTNVDELAFVIGHELAHYKSWHLWSSHANEYAADLLGYNYAKKAGYNMTIGKRLLLRFSKKHSRSHPSGPSRYKRLP